MDLVTIKTFDNITNLGLVQSYLESEGIESYVKDEHLGQVYSGAGIGSLRIKLQVRAEDAEAAAHILIKGGYAKPEDFELDETMLKLSRFFEKISRWFKR